MGVHPGTSTVNQPDLDWLISLGWSVGSCSGPIIVRSRKGGRSLGWGGVGGMFVWVWSAEPRRYCMVLYLTNVPKYELGFVISYHR
jgi:hypothetical protein